MPVYLFSNPKDENNIVEVVMSVHDKHEFYKDGVKWNREFTIPTTAIDTKWNHNDPKDFVRKTSQKRGTIGDLWEKSAELSSKREKEQGKDKVKETFYKNYSKSRGGRLHPNQRKEKLEKIQNTPLKLKIK